MTDWTKYRLAAELAARIGGGILQAWSTRFRVTEKSRANLVTEADFASQQAIFDSLHAEFGDHNFLGEEDQPFPVSDSPYRWIIDPLDGTSNYVHRFPYYAVSIGLEVAGQLIVGVVYDPTRDEMYSAASGQGATLNGVPIQVSTAATLEQAFLMASLPIVAEPDHPAVRRFLNVLPKAQAVQRTGSAALNLANLACGRIDGFWSLSLKPWDMAAGVVIVREAGGSVSTLAGGKFDVMEPDVLAACSPLLLGELRQELAVT